LRVPLTKKQTAAGSCNVIDTITCSVDVVGSLQIQVFAAYRRPQQRVRVDDVFATTEQHSCADVPFGQLQSLSIHIVTR
jgi:hypothetical protein